MKRNSHSEFYDGYNDDGNQSYSNFDYDQRQKYARRQSEKKRSSGQRAGYHRRQYSDMHNRKTRGQVRDYSNIPEINSGNRHLNKIIHSIMDIICAKMDHKLDGIEDLIIKNKRNFRMVKRETEKIQEIIFQDNNLNYANRDLELFSCDKRFFHRLFSSKNVQRRVSGSRKRKEGSRDRSNLAREDSLINQIKRNKSMFKRRIEKGGARKSSHQKKRETGSPLIYDGYYRLEDGRGTDSESKDRYMEAEASLIRKINKSLSISKLVGVYHPSKLGKTKSQFLRDMASVERRRKIESNSNSGKKGYCVKPGCSQHHNNRSHSRGSKKNRREKVKSGSKINPFNTHDYSSERLSLPVDSQYGDSMGRRLLAPPNTSQMVHIQGSNSTIQEDMYEDYETNNIPSISSGQDQIQNNLKKISRFYRNNQEQRYESNASNTREGPKIPNAAKRTTFNQKMRMVENLKFKEEILRKKKEKRMERSRNFVVEKKIQHDDIFNEEKVRRINDSAKRRLIEARDLQSCQGSDAVESEEKLIENFMKKINDLTKSTLEMNYSVNQNVIGYHHEVISKRRSMIKGRGKRKRGQKRKKGSKSRPEFKLDLSQSKKKEQGYNDKHSSMYAGSRISPIKRREEQVRSGSKRTENSSLYKLNHILSSKKDKDLRLNTLESNKETFKTNERSIRKFDILETNDLSSSIRLSGNKSRVVRGSARKKPKNHSTTSSIFNSDYDRVQKTHSPLRSKLKRNPILERKKHKKRSRKSSRRKKTFSSNRKRVEKSKGKEVRSCSKNKRNGAMEGVIKNYDVATPNDGDDSKKGMRGIEDAKHNREGSFSLTRNMKFIPSDAGNGVSSSEINLSPKRDEKAIDVKDDDRQKLHPKELPRRYNEYKETEGRKLSKCSRSQLWKRAMAAVERLSLSKKSSIGSPNKSISKISSKGKVSLQKKKKGTKIHLIKLKNTSENGKQNKRRASVSRSSRFDSIKNSGSNRVFREEESLKFTRKKTLKKSRTMPRNLNQSEDMLNKIQRSSTKVQNGTKNEEKYADFLPRSPPLSPTETNDGPLSPALPITCKYSVSSKLRRVIFSNKIIFEKPPLTEVSFNPVQHESLDDEEQDDRVINDMNLESLKNEMMIQQEKIDSRSPEHLTMGIRNRMDSAFSFKVDNAKIENLSFDGDDVKISSLEEIKDELELDSKERRTLFTSVTKLVEVNDGKRYSLIRKETANFEIKGQKNNTTKEQGESSILIKSIQELSNNSEVVTISHVSKRSLTASIDGENISIGYSPSISFDPNEGLTSKGTSPMNRLSNAMSTFSKLEQSSALSQRKSTVSLSKSRMSKRLSGQMLEPGKIRHSMISNASSYYTDFRDVTEGGSFDPNDVETDGDDQSAFESYINKKESDEEGMSRIGDGEIGEEEGQNIAQNRHSVCSGGETASPRKLFEKEITALSDEDIDLAKGYDSLTKAVEVENSDERKIIDKYGNKKNKFFSPGEEEQSN